MSRARSQAEGSARCLVCRKPLPSEAPHRPFCCARCKLVDLGRWLNEEYKVPGEPAIGFGETPDDEPSGPFAAAAGWEEPGLPWKEPPDEQDA